MKTTSTVDSLRAMIYGEDCSESIYSVCEFETRQSPVWDRVPLHNIANLSCPVWSIDDCWFNLNLNVTAKVCLRFTFCANEWYLTPSVGLHIWRGRTLICSYSVMRTLVIRAYICVSRKLTILIYCIALFSKSLWVQIHFLAIVITKPLYGKPVFL